MDTGAPQNPFSSHLLEPGRGGYIFAPGQSLAQVMARLEEAGWRGELTGNHGAGKSTLLADICAELRRCGLRVTWWQSSDRRRLPPSTWMRDLLQSDVIAYDGAERLLPGLFLFLRALTKSMKRGFIVTTHWRHGYGAVIPVVASATLLAQKFSVEQAEGYSLEEWQQKIDEALARHEGNSRQVLFDLYMEYEDRARQDRPLR